MFSLEVKASKKESSEFPLRIPSEILQGGNSPLSLDTEALPEARAGLDQVSDAAAVQGVVDDIRQDTPEPLIQL